jgi:hypothetical protein
MHVSSYVSLTIVTLVTHSHACFPKWKRLEKAHVNWIWKGPEALLPIKWKLFKLQSSVWECIFFSVLILSIINFFQKVFEEPEITKQSPSTFNDMDAC